MTTKSNPKTEARPISERTRQNYLNTFKSVRNASIAKRTTDEEEPALVTLTQIVEDYFSRQDQANSTRAVTRSAILWIIKSGQVDFTDDAQNALNLLEALKVKVGPKVTIPRPKTIPSKDMDILLDRLYYQAERITNSRASIRTVAWLRAGLACGARPSEWLNTEWVDAEQTQLRIKNGKVKMSGPAFMDKSYAGSSDTRESSLESQEMEELIFWEASVEYEPVTDQTHRIVPIDNDLDRQAINMHLGLIQEIIPTHLDSLDREKAFNVYYETTRVTLARTCRKIWNNKKSYSLYTMRGQFAANMKASKGSAAAAALMGHSSAKSPTAGHYGKGNQAHPRFKTGRASAMPQRQIPAPEKDADRGPIE